MAPFFSGFIPFTLFVTACACFFGYSTAAAGISPQNILTRPNDQRPVHHKTWLHGLSEDELEGWPLYLEEAEDGGALAKPPRLYAEMLDALDQMEGSFYSCSIGNWPEAIDWTAEVVSSQVTTSLFAVSEYTSNQTTTSANEEREQNHENVINRYFTHTMMFYFGEDAFGLRTQAYDDMLWVVLSWLESIKFINLHSNLHFATFQPRHLLTPGNSSWYARQFIPQFAHRARLFYDIASVGWDTSLCGGGMVWNPRLAPYKNAITNQLFITASIWMYLYFPGDDDPSPFLYTSSTSSQDHFREINKPPAKPHDPIYLSNAIDAYKWLKSSNMRNQAGLYVDGFHIRGWRGGRDKSNGTSKCDLRDEKVYTYNQGVVLSGLRGLWEATGNRFYLEDGHELVRNVIRATGWDDRNDDERKWQWAGLGRGGVLEEECDWSGSCSQDGQTFKGIFFWHFTSFCAPLPSDSKDTDRPWLDDETTRALHRNSCRAYEPWVRKNAQAAWMTKDKDGLMGSWWGRPSARSSNDIHGPGREGARQRQEGGPPVSSGTDYRNRGVPWDLIWRITTEERETDEASTRSEWSSDRFAFTASSHAFFGSGAPARKERKHNAVKEENARLHAADLNDRGRGRTVETQSGGLAVVKAAWKMQFDRESER